MRSKKISIYRYDSVLSANYFPKSNSRCILVIGDRSSESYKSRSLSLLKKILSVFCKYDFTMLYLPVKYGFDKSKNQCDLNDVLEAADWLSDKHSEAEFTWICGAGYGGYLSLNAAMRRPRMNGFLSISPILNKDFSINTLTPCPRGLIVHGDSDEYMNYTVAQNLANTLITKKTRSVDFELIEGANHFYDDHIEAFDYTLSNYIDSCIHKTVCQKAVAC